MDKRKDDINGLQFVVFENLLTKHFINLHN